MLVKKDEKGKCPFRDLKPCSEKCTLFRKGIRYNQHNEAVPVELCAFNIMADNLEMTHNRIYQLQAEVGESKNILAMKMVLDMQMGNQATEDTFKRLIQKVVFPDSQVKSITEK